MADLTRIVFITAEEESEQLTDFLALNVPHGWEEQTLSDGRSKFTIHFTHDSGARDFLDVARQGTQFVPSSVEKVEEENWVEAWKEFFTPVEGGSHFYVLAPWMEEERKNTTRIPVLIEPKTAFGTGHHGSTALCLDGISRLFSAGSIQAGNHFMDLGTGSGILGIAACKLGLQGEGLDIDIVAVENAIENRVLNDIASANFPVAQGGVEAANGPYRLVIANILAGPLIDMAPQVVSLVEPGGFLILSGILVAQGKSVQEAYCAQGLPAAEQHIRGEWISLTFTKKA